MYVVDSSHHLAIGSLNANIGTVGTQTPSLDLESFYSAPLALA